MRLRTSADVGAIIRERRRKRGLDQAELAEEVGVSRLWINQVERGKQGASLSLVLRTLSALGIALIADSGNGEKEERQAVVTPDINAIVNAARARNE